MSWKAIADGHVGHRFVDPRDGGGGVYPAILALFNTRRRPLGGKGICKGALYAVATLGSVAALGIYLALFNTTETFLDGASIWLTVRRRSSVSRRPFPMSLESASPWNGARRSTPSFRSPPRRRTKRKDVNGCRCTRRTMRNSGRGSRGHEHARVEGHRERAYRYRFGQFIATGIGVDRLDGVVAPAHGLHVVAPFHSLDGARGRSFTQALELV